MNKKNNNLRKVVKITSFIILLLILIIFGCVIKEKFSPFKTDEEKQLKPVYKAAMKDVSGFRLKHVGIYEEEEDYVIFTFKQKVYTGSNEFKKN